MAEISRRVMIVDDDPDFLEQMRMCLESRGYSVSSASSVQECENQLKETEPDVVVLDLMMDNEDYGFVLSYRIKKQFPKMPVIIVTSMTHETGMDFDETDDPGHWIKADAILAKPIRFEQLEREITRLMRERA